MKLNRTFFLAGALAFLGTPAHAEPPSVVASIKPVHALVSNIMQGVGKPSLIIKGGSSPHTYSLRPSDARALQGADVIFWIGPKLEAFLEKPIGSLGKGARVISLMEAHGLSHVAFREGGPFEGHDHDHHGEDEHDDHEKDGHDKHGHDDHEKDGHDKHGHDAHGDERDHHIWLDPKNAKAMAHEIAEVLSAADPENAARYEANAEALEGQLDSLTVELQKMLEPVHERPFIVFHDAYQHFERRFDLKTAGSITVSPEVIPGAERVANIQQKVKELGATCVFSEPQFTPRLVKVVTEGTTAKSGVLDPLGTGIPNGPGLYFTLLRNMAGSIQEALKMMGGLGLDGAKLANTEDEF